MSPGPLYISLGPLSYYSKQIIATTRRIKLPFTCTKARYRETILDPRPSSSRRALSAGPPLSCTLATGSCCLDHYQGQAASRGYDVFLMQKSSTPLPSRVATGKMRLKFGGCTPFAPFHWHLNESSFSNSQYVFRELRSPFQ